MKRQIGSLQRQAGKARRYQSLISELKTLDTHLSRRNFEVLDAQLTETIAEIERLRDSQIEQEQQIENQEADVAAQRRGLDEMEHNLGAARQVVQDLKSHISNAEHRIGFNHERVREFGSLIERYEGDIAAAEEKLRVQETQIQNTDLELEQILGTLQFEQERLREKTEAVNAVSARRVETENALQTAFNSINRIENRLTSLRGEIASVTNVRDGSQSRLGVLQGEIEQIVAAIEQLSRQSEETAQQVEQSAAALASRQEQAHEAEAQTRSIKSGLDQVDRELVAAQRTLAEKESKLEVLRQLNAEGEGFAEGTQAVLRGLDNPEFFKPAIVGALAGFIEVEQQFIPAIEAALGQNLQAIVTKDTMIAESIIKTLAGKKLGRASLALRELGTRNAECGTNRPLPEGAVAWAIEKVKANEEVEPLVRVLLDDVAIVADLETALRLALQAVPHSGFHIPHFVTLSGEVVTREGIVQGGQGGEAANSVLHRKNQIAQLEAEADGVRATISEITARRGDTVSQLELAQVQHAEARDEVQRLTVFVSTLRGQLSLLEREQRDAENKSRNLHTERETLASRHSEAGEKLTAVETELANTGTNLGELQQHQVELQKHLEAMRANEAELIGELNEMRIKVATEKQRHDSLNNQRQPMNARLLELRELIEQRQRDIEGYQSKSATLAEESTRIQGEIEVTRGKAAEAGQQVAQLLEERSAMVSAVDSLESTLRIMRRQMSECHDQRSQHEVKQTQLQLRIENLCEHVMRRYQIDIREFRPDTYSLLCTLRDQGKRQRKLEAETDASGAAEPLAPAAAETPSASVEPETSIDWERIEATVKELDQRVDSMGPINLEAIQEYDELEQRYTFLEQQNNDLTTSKTELLDVIAKINQTTRKLFAETFEQVRVNFAEMFTELFGGGKANLVLVDESDPLESGIDIIAKPPGKQLQSISLLSGGEKTMTAVALLFAIYMVKPSPFCVLDEMDAPLDESNINRFIKILDRFVAQSQFVVITHNKRTIAKADVLYGVTMEEHGVSKLVGVKFSKREDSSQKSDIIGTTNPVVVPSIAESFGKGDELHSEKAQAG